MGHPDLSHLRGGHRRLTPQRRLIWEVLHGSHSHLTAEELHDEASTRMSELSRPTVYRTLVDLVDANQVREIAVPHGPSRYETICPDDPHSDLVCNVCGRIQKLQDPAVDAVVEVARQRHAFKPDNAHLVIYGTCKDCQGAVAIGPAAAAS